MVHKYVPYQTLLLALIALSLELAAASHFKGAIIQWRPVDPVNFDGRVSLCKELYLSGAKYIILICTAKG